MKPTSASELLAELADSLRKSGEADAAAVLLEHLTPQRLETLVLEATETVAKRHADEVGVELRRLILEQIPEGLNRTS
jgi:hypothetical protein